MRANRDFLRRAVTYLASDKGVSQFLDIGTGIPTSPNVHETAAALVLRPRAAIEAFLDGFTAEPRAWSRLLSGAWTRIPDRRI